MHVPETPTALARSVFDEIEKLKPGDKVLVAFDYDPASEAELGPMATDFVHHCCEKKVKMYFMSLWPVGPVMVQEDIRNIIEADYPHMVYGQDYVNLGYKSGYEGVIKVIVTDLRSLYPTDTRGSSIDQIPMCRGRQEYPEHEAHLISVSAATPGRRNGSSTRRRRTPDKMKLVSGSTGVQSPQLFPLPSRSDGRPVGRHQGSGRVRKAGQRQVLRPDARSEVSRGPPPDGTAAVRPPADDRADHRGQCHLFPPAPRGPLAMKNETRIWIIFFVMAAGFLAWRAANVGIGSQYVREVDGRVAPATVADTVAGTPQFSLSRTVGVWVAAVLTLCIFSFLYRDNPFYKLAESVLVGVSAAYWMVVAYWDVLIPNLFGKIWPSWIQSWAMPGLSPQHDEYWLAYFVPLGLGVMLLWRLRPAEAGSAFGRWLYRSGRRPGCGWWLISRPTS